MQARATPVGRQVAGQVLEGAALQELITMVAELVAHAAGSVCEAIANNYQLNAAVGNMRAMSPLRSMAT